MQSIFTRDYNKPRLGKAKKNTFFLCFSLGLHYFRA